MNVKQRFQLGVGAGLVTMLLGALMVLAPGAGASNETFPESGIHKIDICHRTNAVTNPYVIVNVDIDAGDGSIGKGPDHYQHDLDGGGVFDFDATDLDARYPKPRNGDQWGDIIPPVPLFDDEGSYVGMSAGLNWTEAGQAIYAAGCSKPGTETSDPPVVLVKKTVPDLTVTAPFHFSINGGTSFQVKDGNTSGEHEVTPGSVTLTEDLTNPSGYDLTGVTCTRVSGAFPDGAPVTVQPSNGAVTFSIANDEIVTCEFTNVPRQSDTASVTIVKTNDANENGTYTDEETTSPGAAVPFQLVITNTGTLDLTVTSLTDTWPGQAAPLDLSGEGVLSCGAGEAAKDLNVGDVIPAGTSLTCRFTVQGYAPPAGGARTNTVTLDTNRTEPVADTSIVRTPGEIPPPPTFTIDIDKQNDADDDGDFDNFEFALAEGDDVDFEIRIENTGSGAVTLASLTDTFDGEVVNLLTQAGMSCARGGAPVTLAVGSVLPADSTTVCQFTLTDYAPAPGTDLRNVVALDTEQTLPASDDSIVAVPAVLPEATGTVAVVKEVEGDPVTDWEFGFDGSLGSFRLSDDDPATATIPVAAGEHTVAEDSVLPDGWEFDEAGCVDQDGAVVGAADADGSVDFTVAPNADVTCTFVNTYTAPAAPPPPPQVLPEAEVKGDVVTRTLPRTGDESRGVAGVGALMLALGAAMVIGSKRQLARR